MPSKPEHRKAQSWFSVEKAHEAQLCASKHVIRRNMLPEGIHHIAGVDVAYAGGFSIGAVAVAKYSSLSLVESRTAMLATKLPYIPTLLSFREVPPSAAAISKLHVQPDVLLVDGQGIMHPYRFGFASHLGLVMDKPTIGVAKSPLVGEVGRFTEDGWAPINDKGENVGAALLTKSSPRPLYVSVGHMVSLEKALEIVKYCTSNTRIPKPIIDAHVLATRSAEKPEIVLDKNESEEMP